MSFIQYAKDFDLPTMKPAMIAGFLLKSFKNSLRFDLIKQFIL